MTRKEKISQLNDIFAEINEDDNAVCYLTSEDNELIESAIEALQQKPCEDCISRQAAIDALDTGLWGSEWDKALATAMLKDLPPVQPKLKTGHWIPVSERLPEIRQDVLCQCRANFYSILRLNQDSDWECIYPHTTYMQSFVIAWMPLPEPYEPQESEE